MFKQTLLSAVALVAFAGIAQASTLDVILGSAPNTIGSYSAGSGSLVANISPSSATLGGDAAVVPASFASSGLAAPPSGNQMSTYLYVTGNAGSSATFSLSSNNFGLTWGSIDTYNTLTLTDSLGNSYSITGAQIIANMTSPTAGTTQADVVFNDPYAKIVSAVLTSSENSFEAANFSSLAAQVPLPASAVLFGMALAGLALVARRKAVI